MMCNLRPCMCFPIVFGAHMNILFIIKVKTCFINESYRPLQISRVAYVGSYWVRVHMGTYFGYSINIAHPIGKYFRKVKHTYKHVSNTKYFGVAQTLRHKIVASPIIIKSYNLELHYNRMQVTLLLD